MAARVAVLGGMALLSQLSCGDDPLPPCTTANCELPGSTVVKWIFNHYPEKMFDSDGCSDLGAVTVRIDAVKIDDPTVTESAEKECSIRQTTFIDLPLGEYEFSLTPLDANGESLVTAPLRVTAFAGSSGARAEVLVLVPYEAWARSYTGMFLYRLAWGGMSCDPAMVAVQNLTLVAGGQLVSQRNNHGHAMNGSEDAPCWPLTSSSPENVMELPFGPATFHVVGKDASDEVLFEQEFDTFIGAGKFNPTLTFDVAPVPPPDAGVPDAPLDAPPDSM